MAEAAQDKKKSFHEEFARYFEAPGRETLRDLLRGHVGEADNLDFKSAWAECPKPARHLLGLANSEGGCLVAGVN